MLEKSHEHVSDSMSVEYMVGTVDSAAGVRVDTLRERHYHKEIKNDSIATTQGESKQNTIYRTIKETHTKTTTKTTDLTRWQRFRMNMGSVFIMLMLLFIVALLFRKTKG